MWLKVGQVLHWSHLASGRYEALFKEQQCLGKEGTSEIHLHVSAMQYTFHKYYGLMSLPCHLYWEERHYLLLIIPNLLLNIYFLIIIFFPITSFAPFWADTDICSGVCLKIIVTKSSRQRWQLAILLKSGQVHGFSLYPKSCESVHPSSSWHAAGGCRLDADFANELPRQA